MSFPYTPSTNLRGDLVEDNSNVLVIAGQMALPAPGITIEVKQATVSQSGYLSSADWATFNAKQPAGNYITALTGDVTAAGPGSVAATIASGAVSLAKMANLAANSIIGNNTAAPATPLALTVAQVQTLLGITDSAVIDPGHKHSKLWASDGSPEAVTVDAEGKVGIGTASPLDKLDVFGGGGRFHGAAGNSATMILYNNNAVINGFARGQGAYSGTDNIAFLINMANAAMIFGTNNTEKMRLDSSGNVGIGTTSPHEKLEVNGRGLFWNLQAAGSNPAVAQTRNAAEFLLAASSMITIGENSAGDANPALTFYRTSAGGRTGTAMRIFQPSNSQKLLFQQGSATTAYGSETYTDVMALNAGNVGIGTTSPTGKLHVVGSGTNGVIYTKGTGNTSTDGITIENADADTTLRLWVDANSVATIGRGTAQSLNIDSGGNVGIGTTSPGKKVDVTGDIRASLQLISTIAVGTAPLVVTSTTLVDNLNADLLDGVEAAAFALADGSRAFTGAVAMGGNKIGGLAAASASGDAVRYDEWTAAQDPGHKHSALWASDGNPKAIYTDTDGNVYIWGLTTGTLSDIDLHVGHSYPGVHDVAAFVNNHTPTVGDGSGIGFWSADNSTAIQTGAIRGVISSGDSWMDFSSYVAFLTSQTGVLIEAARFDGSGNFSVGGIADRATTIGTKVLHIFDGTAPIGTLANGCSIYSASGELYTMDAAGTATLQTPHDDEGLWVFYSIDTRTGKKLHIDMEKMMRFLNEKFGTDFVHDNFNLN